MLKRIMTFSFWDKALARALRTAIQGILGSLAGCAVIQDMNVKLIVSTTLVTVLVSILASMVAGLPEISDEDFAE